MYKILTVEDTVRVPPRRFDENLKTVITSEFENTITGRIDKNVGIVLSVLKVVDMGEGKIIMGDGAIYYNVTLEVLVYQPVLNEVIEGSVSEIIEFGAFVNFGPMDGLAHVSQITEDYMSYDQKNSMLVGKETKKTLKLGDTIRARIVSVSLKPKFSSSKIGLTMRQPYLGKLDWLEEEKKAQKKKETKVEKKEKPREKK
ncbi:MAG: DNA-directed RNA polymerase [Candidatus Altiarchaeota archaeon]|nr:DNA-directed RNA polymerase [Candidatus Altiarchaeota archaeon]